MKKIQCGVTTILALVAVMAMAEVAVETKVESVKPDATCVKATPAACDQVKTSGCDKHQAKAGCPMMAAKTGATCAAGVKSVGKTCDKTVTGCAKMTNASCKNAQPDGDKTACKAKTDTVCCGAVTPAQPTAEPKAE